MSDGMEGRTFDKEYFDRYCGPVPQVRGTGVWESAFAEAGAGLVTTFQPKRVLDVGCGMGFLVEQLRDLGVEAYGTDISTYALDNAREDVRPFIRPASAVDPIDGRYDVITCLGVAEHVPSADAAQLVHNLCSNTDEVIFSAGAGDHGNPYAVNVQSDEYWRELFANHDFYPVLRDGPDWFPTEVIHYRRVDRRLRVAVFTREKEDWAVLRLRLLDPLKELEQSGRIEVTVVSRHAATVPIETLVSADIWVMHREFADAELSQGVLEAARLLNKVVVFEIDDLVTRVPTHHAMHDYLTGVRDDVLSAAREADFVTGTTARLLGDLAEDEPSIAEKAHVLPNVVDSELWGSTFRPRVRESGDALVVGWSGSMLHDEDLAVVADAIRYLRRKHGDEIEFHFYGYVPHALRGIDGVHLARRATADYHAHIRTAKDAHVHVGIAPLTDDAFNQGKSEVKWLEYSISGIPGIYSNVAPYAAAVRDGETGLIVDNTTEAWVAAIERLMADDELRQRIAANAHRQVIDAHTVAGNASRWDELYRAFLATGPRFTELCRADLDAEAAGARAAALLFALQARHQLRASQHAGAVASMEAAIDMDASLVDVAIETADAQLEQGEVALAERLLRVVIALAPESEAAILLLSQLYQRQGDTLSAARLMSDTEERHAASLHHAGEQISLLRAHGDEDGVIARLDRLIATEPDVEAVIAIAELCVGLGHHAQALAAVEQTAAKHPETDFDRLRRALAVAAQNNGAPATPQDDGIRVAVYTREPLSSARFEQRIGAPLGVLQCAGQIAVRVSDGVIWSDIADWADVVVLQGSFVDRAHGAAEGIVARCRSAGKPIVYEIDDLPFERLALAGADGAIALRDDVAWAIGEADAITVPTEGLAAALGGIQPGARDKITVLPTCVDPERWDSTAKWEDAVNRPFHVGVVTDWARPSEVAELIHSLAPVFAQSDRRFTLTTWSPRIEPGEQLPTDPVIGSATPFFHEYATRIQSRQLDLALVPVSNDLYYTTLSDSIWAELALCRTPGIFSAREPFASTIENGADGLMMGDRFEDWLSVVANTIDCPSLRRSMADQAWLRVYSERLIQPAAVRWADLYRSLIGTATRCDGHTVPEHANAEPAGAS